MEKSILSQLHNNINIVMALLETLPIRVSSNNDEGVIRFDTYEHSSNAYSLNLNTLSYFNFRENKGGSILQLISELTGKTMDKVCSEVYLMFVTQGEIKPCENTVYEFKEYEFLTPEAYDERLLENYTPTISELFKKDNLWITTQIYWGIRYDYRTHRVVIPVYQDYDLVGAIGRLNKEKVEDTENKYFPILNYSKSRVLFGYDEYKERIKKVGKAILVESEKSVMKAWQYNSRIPVLAIGGSNISRHHIERLNLLGVKHIILALDKGIECEDVLQGNLRKLQTYSNAKILQYIDVDNCDLLEDKECIFDREQEVINHCFKNHVITIKEER